jgi:hypothetical protein
MDCKTAHMLLEFHRPHSEELDSDETDALENHLRDCSDCAHLAHTEQQADEHLGVAVRAVATPVDLRERILKALANGRRNRWRRRLRWTAAAAAVLLAVGLGLGYRLSARPTIDVNEIVDNLVAPESSAEEIEEWFKTTYGVKTTLPRSLRYSNFITASREERQGKLAPRLLFLRKPDRQDKQQDRQDFAEVWVLSPDQFDLKASAKKPLQAGTGRINVELMLNQDGGNACLILYSGGPLDWLIIPEPPAQ